MKIFLVVDENGERPRRAEKNLLHLVKVNVNFPCAPLCAARRHFSVQAGEEAKDIPRGIFSLTEKQRSTYAEKGRTSEEFKLMFSDICSVVCYETNFRR
jgi:hypothetical protein